MKQADLKLLLQLFAAGVLVILIIPAALVFFSGGFGKQGDSDAPNADTLLSGKIPIPETIEVWLESEQRTESVEFEDYVCRVTASEMPGDFEPEALKAQSVAARTYAMARLTAYEEKKPVNHPEAPVCDTTHCQVYRDEESLIDVHAEGWEDEEWKRVQKACRETEGQLLYYDGELVKQPLFFSSSGGQTENSEDVFVSAVPYLVSVASPYEEDATHRDEEVVLEVADFEEKIKDSYPEREIGDVSIDTIKILSRTAGGRVEKIQVGDGAEGILKGTEVRTAAGLSSALFSVSFRDGTKIVFTSSGSGHGVGMSQYGANGMAKEGYDYEEILQHYYRGTSVH